MRKSISLTPLAGPLGVASQWIRWGSSVSPRSVLLTPNVERDALTECDGSTDGDPVAPQPPRYMPNITMRAPGMRIGRLLLVRVDAGRRGVRRRGVKAGS